MEGPMNVIEYDRIKNQLANLRIDTEGHRVFGVPRGGMCAAALLTRATVVTDSAAATVILDDIIDSGKTRDFYREKHPGTPFVSLFEKGPDDGWVVFPWEVTRDGRTEGSPEDAVVRIIEWIGDDPNREGLKDTPRRVLKAFQEMTTGIRTTDDDLCGILGTTFAERGADELVVVKNITFSSLCEHHLLPFFGHAHVAYIPTGGEIVGLSKFARLVRAVASRPQVQERITAKVASIINEVLKPLGVGVVTVCKHACMSCRGVEQLDSVAVSSSMHGSFRDSGPARAELLALI